MWDNMFDEKCHCRHRICHGTVLCRIQSSLTYEQTKGQRTTHAYIHSSTIAN